MEKGGIVLPPDPTDAVPAGGVVAQHGLRTLPPRENCGNADVKQLTKGSLLYVPVAVEGALYSAGDGHFAQGDSECCVTAIEMAGTQAVRFQVHKGEAARTEHPMAPIRPSRLLPTASMVRPATLHRHNGYACHGRWGEPGRRPDPGGEKRPAKHD